MGLTVPGEVPRSSRSFSVLLSSTSVRRCRAMVPALSGVGVSSGDGGVTNDPPVAPPDEVPPAPKTPEVPAAPDGAGRPPLPEAPTPAETAARAEGAAGVRSWRDRAARVGATRVLTDHVGRPTADTDHTDKEGQRGQRRANWARGDFHGLSLSDVGGPHVHPLRAVSSPPYIAAPNVAVGMPIALARAMRTPLLGALVRLRLRPVWK